MNICVFVYVLSQVLMIRNAVCEFAAVSYEYCVTRLTFCLTGTYFCW